MAGSSEKNENRSLLFRFFFFSRRIHSIHITPKKIKSNKKGTHANKRISRKIRSKSATLVTSPYVFCAIARAMAVPP